MNKVAVITLLVLVLLVSGCIKQKLFITTDLNKEEDYCTYNNYNVIVYYKRLHNFIHTNPSDKELLEFIDKDECVEDGSVKHVGHLLVVEARWKSNNEIVIFSH